MQKTCTQKVQPQKPRPRKMPKKTTTQMQTKMQKKTTSGFFCKTCTVPELAFFSNFLCIVFAFSSGFSNFLNFWSSNRRSPQKCKKCTIPEFAFFVLFFSHFFSIAFLFAFFLHFYLVVAFFACFLIAFFLGYFFKVWIS